MAKKELKLHLGCGNKIHKEYINIDIQYNPYLDSQEDIRILRKYADNSVDKIYACHVLEHISRWEYLNVLKRWYTILKEGGRLRIAVPNFDACVAMYQKTKDLPLIIGLLYGGQDYPNNHHFYIWTFDTMKKDLESVGFKNIALYDWRKDDFWNIDDYSKSYIPHMDQKNGTLMSLNIEAFK